MSRAVFSQRIAHLRCQSCSVDRYLVGEFCSRAGARVSTWPVGNSTEFAAQMMVCNTSAVFMLFTWINGAVFRVSRPSFDTHQTMHSERILCGCS